MYTLTCKDALMTDCPFVAIDKTIDGVMSKIKDHGSDVHMKEIEQMSGSMSKKEMTEKMRSAVKEEK